MRARRSSYGRGGRSCRPPLDECLDRWRCNEGLKPRDLGGKDPTAEWRDPVVSTSLVVELGHRTPVSFGYEAVSEESLDDPIEVPGLERYESVRSLGDVLYEGVPVTFLLGEAEQELQVERLEWKEAAWGA